MVKVRIQGLPHEVKSAVAKLDKVFTVHEVSSPYPNRGSEYVRVYVDAEPKKDPKPKKAYAVPPSPVPLNLIIE